MVERWFDLPIYGEKIGILVVEEPDDAEAVCDVLRESVNPDEDLLSDTYGKIIGSYLNGAETWKNLSRCIFVILLYPHTGIDKVVNSLAHELSHLTGFICDLHGLTCDESRAYLQGYLASTVYNMALNYRIVNVEVGEYGELYRTEKKMHHGEDMEAENSTLAHRKDLGSVAVDVMNNI